MRKVLRILGIIVLILVVMVIGIRLALPYVVVKIANKKLQEILNTEASVGELKLGLLRGYLSIRNIRIAQPEGFGEGELLLVPEVSVKVKLASIFSPPLTVEEVTLSDWVVNVVKNEDGVMNIDAVQPQSAPAPLPAPAPSGAKKQEEQEPVKPILIKKLVIRNLSCSYTDYAVGIEPAGAPKGETRDSAAIAGETEAGGIAASSPSPAPASSRSDRVSSARRPRRRSSTALSLSSAAETEAVASEIPATGETPAQSGGKPPAEELSGNGEEEKVLQVKIAGLNLLLTNLLIDPSVDPARIEPAELLLTARIVQNPFSDGLLGLDARLGPVGAGIPAVNAVLRLGDLELEPLDVIVPAGSAQVLGGSALDLSADLAMSPDVLDCEITVEVAGGHTLPLSIGGTPDKPEVDMSSILFGVMLHLGGGVGSLVGNVGGATYQVGAAAAETTLAVGKGAVNVVGSIGGGLFKSVTSAATGDLNGAAKGLGDATVGTAGKAASAADGVADEVATGAAAAAESTIGQDADRKWRAATKERWEKAWAEGRKILGEMPFPPPVPEKGAEVAAASSPQGTVPPPVEELSPSPVPDGF